jgi:hypothetical protein
LLGRSIEGISNRTDRTFLRLGHEQDVHERILGKESSKLIPKRSNEGPIRSGSAPNGENHGLFRPLIARYAHQVRGSDVSVGSEDLSPPRFQFALRNAILFTQKLDIVNPTPLRTSRRVLAQEVEQAS